MARQIAQSGIIAREDRRMAMLNVSALITGYDTVGDHTEFIVEVRGRYMTSLSFCTDG
jgi:hypothetical protein